VAGRRSLLEEFGRPLLVARRCPPGLGHRPAQAGVAPSLRAGRGGMLDVAPYLRDRRRGRSCTCAQPSFGIGGRLMQAREKHFRPRRDRRHDSSRPRGAKPARHRPRRSAGRARRRLRRAAPRAAPPVARSFRLEGVGQGFRLRLFDLVGLQLADDLVNRLRRHRCIPVFGDEDPLVGIEGALRQRPCPRRRRRRSAASPARSRARRHRATAASPC